MKLARIASDLHTECWFNDPSRINQVIPIMEDDKSTLLFLAGDIGTVKNQEVLWGVLELLSERFQHIYYIFGNHECWGASSLREGEAQLYDLTMDIPNLSVGLTRDLVKGMPQRKIHMHTLWTNFDNDNPLAKLQAESHMADYYRIGKLTTEQVLKEHQMAVQQISEYAKFKDVIMTHHLPSFQSCDTAFKDSPFNPAFASNLEELIEATQPQLWIHGHTHASCDYMIGETRVICNPYGYYPNGINPDYNPNLIVEIK